jgi:hypothetical protein
MTELSVKIYKISETKKVSDSFSKREFIVETDTQYKQYLLLQVVTDKCAVLDGYEVGENVKVSLNLNGRLWTNPQGEEKCFNTLDCWRIEKTESNDPTPQPQPAGVQEGDKVGKGTEEEADDLPF